MSQCHVYQLGMTFVFSLTTLISESMAQGDKKQPLENAPSKKIGKKSGKNRGNNDSQSNKKTTKK